MQGGQCPSLLTIINYSSQRPQFGGKLILEYLTHQWRLLPALATTYAMHVAMTRLKVQQSPSS